MYRYLTWYTHNVGYILKCIPGIIPAMKCQLATINKNTSGIIPRNVRYVHVMLQACMKQSGIEMSQT